MHSILVYIILLASPTRADDSTSEVESFFEANASNLTSLREVMAPPWVSSPQFRGSTKILWSCLITIVACVYTALHLDIISSEEPVSPLVVKLRVVAVTLPFPEFVLYRAASQFFDAQSLKKKLNRLLKGSNQLDEEAIAAGKQVCNLRYCFFAERGGFRARTGDT